MRRSKAVKKKKIQSRDFNEQEMKVLEQVVSVEKFNFSDYDLELVKNPDTPKSSKSHGRAEVVIKKIKGMQKALAKEQWKQQQAEKAAQDSPFMTKQYAFRTFVRLSEGQELGATIEVLSDLLIKNKLITQKGLDKLIQERLLEGRHPDPCPKCKGYEPKPKKGEPHCIITREDHKPTLAKEQYPDLIGAKAKRVIACSSYSLDANPNPEFPEEPKDVQTETRTKESNKTS
jgi:hypothetical protein